MEESKMLKKGISVLLVILLLCPAVNALAVSARLKTNMSTRSGPGTWFTEELGTLPSSTSVAAIEKITTSETTWVLVEFRSNGQLYRAYTGLSRLEVYGDLPVANASGYGDTVLTETSAYYGPGAQYANRRLRVPAGTGVTVYGQEDQWAFCEYRENGKMVRGYLAVNTLRTAGSTQSQAAAPTEIPYYWSSWNNNPIVAASPAAGAVTDYYGKPFSGAGHTPEFLTLVEKLPVMNYFDGVPCARQSDVYSGPGADYWRPYTQSGYAYTGTSDVLRVYCQENGWLLIRYPTQTGYRYGWTQLTAIPSNLLYWAKEFERADLPVITTADTAAMADPDTPGASGMPASAGIMMTALAFLDETRAWVYCEFTVLDNGEYSLCRGFVPSDALRERDVDTNSF